MKELNRKPLDRLVSAFLTLLIITSSIFVVVRFQMTTDMGLFMPPAKTPVEEVLMQQLKKGATTNLIFASLEGAGPDVLLKVNRQLRKIITEHALVTRVINGPIMLDEDELNFIAGYRYLLSDVDGDKDFSVSGLKRSFDERLAGLASATAVFEKRFLRQDPSGEMFKLLSRWSDNQDQRRTPVLLNGVWFSVDRQRSLFIVETATTGIEIKKQAAVVAFMYQQFSRLQQTVDGAGSMSLLLSGPSVFAVETRDSIRRDVNFLSVMAVLLVGIFLVWVLRSWRLLALVLVPLCLGIITAVASVIWVFGAIHGITLAFGVTLTGVAVDYPLHLFSHLDGTRSEVFRHASRIWPTLRLGVVTTVIAYLSLVFSEFDGLKQLGMFTVVGLLVAAAVTRWILPAILPRKLPTRHGANALHALLEKAGRNAHRIKLHAAMLVVLCIGFLLLTEDNLRNINMDSISTISAERRAQDRQIRQDLGFWYGGRLLIVTASDVEGVLRSQERLQAVLDAWVQDESISRYTQVSNFLPSAERQKKRQANLPTLDDLRSRLQQARAQTPFKPGTFEPFLQDVELARQQAVLTPDTVALPSLKARIEPLLFELNKRWVAPVLLYDVQDEAAIELGLKTLRNIDVTYIYLKGESSRILDAAIDRVLRVLGWGGLFIYLVLSFSFRDLLKPFRVLGPTIASVVVVSAIFVFNGIYLTLFHLVSLLLVIGLGLDYSLFFNRLARDESEWGTTFRALWICCVTTVFVFGALLYSETPPLRAIGQTVGLGAGFCLIFGAIWSSNANRHHYRERLQKALARRKVARRAA